MVQYLSMSLIPVIQAGDAQYLYGEVMNTGDVDSDEVSSLLGGVEGGPVSQYVPDSCDPGRG